MPEAAKSRLLAGGTAVEAKPREAGHSLDIDLFDSVDRFLLGLSRYYAKDHKQAGRQFESASQAYPDHYWSQYFLALCHLSARRWGEARVTLERLPGP